MDHVWPEVPLNQWVLTLPPRSRYALAWRHDLSTAVVGVLFRAVQRHPRTWAQTRRLGDARSGAITVVQRFGGALNLNVHLHALVLDGVFARAGDGQLRFHRAPLPSAADVLAAIAPADGRVVFRLRHPWADGTTHVAFEPTAFLERLAVLVPRPRVNSLIYYGVLAAHAAWRGGGAGVWCGARGRVCGVGRRAWYPAGCRGAPAAVSAPARSLRFRRRWR